MQGEFFLQDVKIEGSEDYHDLLLFVPGFTGKCNSLTYLCITTPGLIYSLRFTGKDFVH